jgi:hypothetical protein
MSPLFWLLPLIFTPTRHPSKRSGVRCRVATRPHGISGIGYRVLTRISPKKSGIGCRVSLGCNALPLTSLRPLTSHLTSRSRLHQPLAPTLLLPIKQRNTQWNRYRPLPTSNITALSDASKICLSSLIQRKITSAACFKLRLDS